MSAVVLGCVPGIVTGLLSEANTRVFQTRSLSITKEYLSHIFSLIKRWQTSSQNIDANKIPKPSTNDPKNWLVCPHKDTCSASKQIDDCHKEREAICVRYKKFREDDDVLCSEVALKGVIITLGIVALSILLAPRALTRETYPYYIALSMASSFIGTCSPMVMRIAMGR